MHKKLILNFSIFKLFILVSLNFTNCNLIDIRESKVKEIGCIGFTVNNMNRSLKFYTDVLNFNVNSKLKYKNINIDKLENLTDVSKVVAKLQLGSECLELTEYKNQKGKPYPADFKSNDEIFQHIAIVVSDMDIAYNILRKFNIIPISKNGPETIPNTNPNAGGIKAFYFKDPDNHPLEIIYFPAGKGEIRWQNKDKIFLGIDHTALVVRDTEESLKFYRDFLGMKIVGESKNYGIEQERLGNVEGAIVKITTLKSEIGPGIEFLEYESPKNGKKFPAKINTNELYFWNINIFVNENFITDLDLENRDNLTNKISIKPIKFENYLLYILRDPSGHPLKFHAKIN